MENCLSPSPPQGACGKVTLCPCFPFRLLLTPCFRYSGNLWWTRGSKELKSVGELLLFHIFCLRMTHYYYFWASKQQVGLVKGVLNSCASSTGQLINPSKCYILLSDNCPPAVSMEIKNILDVTQEVFKPKYLGLLLSEGRMHKGKFETVQVVLSKRLVDWSE